MRISLLFASLVTLPLVACSGDKSKDAVDPADTDTDLGTDAALRVIHLSPDAPPFHVYTNDGDTPVYADLTFQMGSSTVLTTPGSISLQVVPTGSPDGTALLDVDYTLAASTAYTAVVYARTASLSSVLLEDDGAGIDAGTVRLQFVQSAADFTSVDLLELPATVLSDDLALGNSASVDRPVGAMALGLDRNDDAVPDYRFSVPELEGGAAYNVFVVTTGTGTPFLLVQSPDDSVVRIDTDAEPPASRVRVMHLSPDAPTLDVFLDAGATASFSALAYEQGSIYGIFSPGVHTFSMASTGGTAADAILAVPEQTFEDATRYSVVAYGPAASLAALTLVDDYSGIPAGSVRLQISHTAHDVGSVDLYSAGTRIADNFAYGATTSVDVVSAALEIGLDTNEDGTPDLTFTVPALGVDTLVNLFAVADDAGVYLVAQLADGAESVILAD